MPIPAIPTKWMCFGVMKMIFDVEMWLQYKKYSRKGKAKNILFAGREEQPVNLFRPSLLQFFRALVGGGSGGDDVIEEDDILSSDGL